MTRLLALSTAMLALVTALLALLALSTAMLAQTPVMAALSTASSTAVQFSPAPPPLTSAVAIDVFLLGLILGAAMTWMLLGREVEGRAENRLPEPLDLPKDFRV